MKTKKHLKIIELVKEIDAIVEQNSDVHSRLAQLLESVNDQDVAAILDINPESRQLVFKSVASARRTAVLDLVNGHTLRSITGHLTDHELAQAVQTSPSIVSQKIVSTIERSRLNRLIPMVSDEQRRKNLLSFVNYPKRSVGRIMQTEMVTVKVDMTAQQALHEVINFDVFSGPLYQVYILNDDEELVGTIALSELLREPNAKKLHEVLIKKPPLITPQTSQQKAAQLFQEYDLIEAPITSEGKLMGRVLVDDILDVIQQEFTEDLQKFAGITSYETMETSALQSSRRRLPWMIVNIFLDLVAVSVIMPFEATIAQVTALAVIMPIVSDMGGNVGIQSLSVCVRALAANRPDWKLVRRELSKEVRVGVLNGTVLGMIVGVIAYIMWGNPFLGLIVMTALFLNTIIASIVGGILPIILRRLNKDPAMMSGSVLTTVTDFFGFLLFLSLARTFMDYLV